MAELITGLAYSVDLNDPVVRVKESGVFVRGDSYQQIAFTIMRGTEAVDLSNVQAIVWFINSNGISPFIVGTIADNVITVNVTPECTANVGRLYIQLQLGDTGHHTQTPIIIETHIVANATDAIVDTGNVLPSLNELLSQVEACETATVAATDAAEALDGITAEATTLAVGQSATAEMETDPLDGHYNVVLGIPQAQRGTKAYSGTTITGTSVTPTVYATGITDAIIGDRYSYNGADPADIGNEYVCTLGGDAATALWIFLRNLRGAPGEGSPSDANPLMNGAVSPGDDGTYSRSDHVHPSDTAKLGLSGGNMTGAINEALVASMALASTMNIGAAAGNYIIVTAGTGPITAFDSAPAGARRFMRFSVSATINYNATTMLIPGAANLTVVSGDVLEWVSGGAGVWQCVNIERWNRIEPSRMMRTTLLWTNPSPTSDFSAQKITVDMSGYTHKMILFYAVTNVQNTLPAVINTVDGAGHITTISASSYKLFARNFTSDATGVTFGDGKVVDPYGTGNTAVSVCVPYAIYGINGM